MFGLPPGGLIKELLQVPWHLDTVRQLHVRSLVGPLKRDIYIPICNDPVNDYWEWGQRIMLYKRKLTLQGKELVG